MNGIALVFAGVLSVAPLAAAAQDAAPWKPLYERVDTELQRNLDERIAANPEWRALVKRKKLALCTVDLSTSPPRFARVNGNQMMYAASLPKIAIMLGIYASFDDGTLAESDAVHQDLTQMIRVSSNAAATRLIDRIGMKKIQQAVQDERFGLYDEDRGGGLWVGKRYAKVGPRVGDPMHGISHGATATQVCRFYYLLASGRLISPERSEQMLSELQDPGLHHKFVAELDKRAPKATVFRKSGTWRQWHSDSVLVRGIRWRNYVLVGLVENARGEAILRALLPAVEDLLRLPADEPRDMASRHTR